MIFAGADHHLRAGLFQALAFLRKAPDLGRPITTFAVVGGQVLADGALAEPDGLRDLALHLSGLLHVGDHLTAFRTEAVVFVTHSQFVVKPDWMNPRL